MQAAERWREALAQLGSPRIRRIVATHFHPDHLGGVGALAELTGAEVLQGRIDKDVTERMYGHARLRNVPKPDVDRLLDAGERIEAGGRELTVLHLPGHADGHIVLHDERDGLLFGGDVILNRISPNVTAWPGGEPDPLALYLGTLDRLAALDLRLVHPGHHDEITDVEGRTAEIRDLHRERLDEMEGILRRGAASPDDVLVAVWGDALGEFEQQFAYGETMSHLVRLERLGRAREVEPGLWAAA
jgi:glyoxylase-like metal-dependent hydrolase (beta-lactamase superfamily II)